MHYIDKISKNDRYQIIFQRLKTFNHRWYWAFFEPSLSPEDRKMPTIWCNGPGSRIQLLWAEATSRVIAIWPRDDPNNTFTCPAFYLWHAMTYCIKCCSVFQNCKTWKGKLIGSVMALKKRGNSKEDEWRVRSASFKRSWSISNFLWKKCFCVGYQTIFKT